MSGYNDVPDHPIIRNMERTGYPDGKEPRCPICPVCGEECETIYKTKNLDIAGCDLCVAAADAWEVPDCFPDYERSYPND